MEKPKAIRNVYCDPGELVVEHSCVCCKKCWLFVSGPRRGKCPFNGPFDGYVRADA